MARFYLARVVLSLFQARYLLAQRLRNGTTVVHPLLNWSKCTLAGGCSLVNGSVVNSQPWYHFVSNGAPCWENHVWNSTFCPDAQTCYENCTIRGADYAKIFGITSSNDAVMMKFFTQSSEVNIGNSVILLDPVSSQATPTNHYQIFYPLNMELSFDVDASQLPCGLASSLSFKEISADGGISEDPLNKAGAGWGTGNCDGRCSTDRLFIHGLPNVGNTIGACCNEFRIWHGNAVSQTMVAHPCLSPGLSTCIAKSAGGQCVNTDCDLTGCEFNPFREASPGFYGVGPAFRLDTSRKFTVRTQFITNSSTGALSSIRRFHIQNGTILQTPISHFTGMTEFSDRNCNEQKVVFEEPNLFASLGGLTTLGKAFERGMVLEMSIDEDQTDNMLQLDSTFPPHANPQLPGVRRSLCGKNTGFPADVETNNRTAQVVFSNIKFGPIGSL
ncbi:glycoside hydrolase [Mycena leptocephala]|nr:glycoside hydrolase [Mycena leptocephala]